MGDKGGIRGQDQDLLVPVLKKDRLSTVPTLRNVMRKAGNHRARHSSHGEN
jgi:hypothetical protein